MIKHLGPLSLIFLIVLLCAAVLPVQVLGQSHEQSFQIASVEIEGCRRVDAQAVQEQLEHRSGTVTAAQIDSDVKRIYATGFFDQVSATLVDDGEKKSLKRIKYRVVEKAIVRKVFIQGNDEVDEDELSEIFTFGSARFVGKAKLHALMRQAESFYQARGYYDATLDYSMTPVADNQVDVTVLVKEGERYHIDQISFRGLKELDEDQLLDVMQTKTYKWWSSWLFGTGRLNEEMLENDRSLIRQFFYDNGLLDASISEPAIEKKDGEITIQFNVKEGQPYSVSGIQVEGDLIEESPEKTLEGITSKSGETFNASFMRADAFLISDKFSDIGYAYANVVPDTQIDAQNKQVGLVYRVDQGKPVTVRNINVRGNKKTYDHVIRREMRIDEQELYSGKKVKRSQTLLERLGYFEEVNISTDSTERDDQVDLTVNVREGSTGSFSAGAGYSTSDGAIFNMRLSEDNIFGTGKRVVANLDVGTQRENIILSYVDRRFLDSFTSMGVDLLATERMFIDFDRSMKGGSILFGYPLEEWLGEWSQDVSASVKYEYLDIDINNVDVNDAAQLVIDSQGNATASGVTPRLVRSTINNRLNPTSGSRQILQVELTGLGGSEEYYLFEAENQIYYPFWEPSFGPFVFSWRADVGYGETYDGDPFPLFRRYFPGGINSVRGFDARTLGPKDQNGNEFGGSKQLISNFEVIFPLINAAGLRGVVFYDFGEAFDDNINISLADLRRAYGFGLRWMSPLGPIRIEFGFPADRRAGEDSVVTQFSFGGPL